MLDLYYFSFNVIDQVHLPDLAGVLVSPPPKKGSRGGLGHRSGASRENDLLVLFLSLAGKNSVKEEELNALLERTAQTYYKSSGSLTSGMRAAAETCNAELMERNLKSARDEGGQAIARLNLAVLRNDTLFLAVAGPTHAFVLGADEVQDCYDPQSSRGLGAGSSVTLRYFQAHLQPGDVLVFAPEPPAAWTPETLTGCPVLTLEHLRRRLLNGIGPNLQAVVFKFQSGSGTLHALRHRSTTTNAPMAYPPTPSGPASSLPEPTVPPASPSRAASQISANAPVPSRPIPQPSTGGQPKVGAGLVPALVGPPPTPAPLREPRSAARRTHPGRPVPTADVPTLPEEPPAVPVSQISPLETVRLARQRRAERKQKAAAVWAGWKGFNARINQGWRGLTTRLSPQRTARAASLPHAEDIQPRSTISPALLVFIAIAVPLIVVAISLTVTMQTGRSEQRQVYYQQAATFAQQAMAQSDPLLQRNNWAQVLQWLDKTEEYGITSDSRALRVRAQQGVDSVDAINRVEFKPVNRIGFANAVQITSLVSNGDDLYLLDSSNGSVLRLFLTAQGYEMDTQFNCGPGIVDTIIVGPLVDITPMPPVNPKNATIAALDSGGNLVYCIPGKAPAVRTLAPPNVGWGKITAVSIVQDTLYVLDVLGNAVWEFDGKDLVFPDRPHLFSEKFNLSMANVIDIAQYDDYVYFLRKTGQISRCILSKVQELPTRCDDPVKYSDGRPGREQNPQIMPETLFTQILAINAPDPSLYLLDAKNAAVYRFSVVLNFQDQMRPSGTTDTPLPHREPTAFTITPRRIVFLAYGNQLFMGQMP